MDHAILIGNGINNLSNTKSWAELVNEMIAITDTDINTTSKKPFPLMYEEIFMNAHAFNQNERILKQKIGEIVNQITANEIHEEILSLDCTHYLTTNYDFVLEQALDDRLSPRQLQNKGVVNEKKFNIFRHTKVKDKNVWHIHGDIQTARSITLGFEHYGGQLQRLRNYVVNGAIYRGREKYAMPLHKRLEMDDVDHSSWVDLMYTHTIHIVGLGLGYEETDLWWLLTKRARFYLKRPKMQQNRIVYYSPAKYKDEGKTELMNAIHVETVFIEKEGKEFYRDVIQSIEREMKSNK
ncbi:MAG: SIR2 family protein [Saprospiraceae bacterium]|nr:SIR2 family protein [Saprospiraceae bacterium]